MKKVSFTRQVNPYTLIDLKVTIVRFKKFPIKVLILDYDRLEERFFVEDYDGAKGYIYLHQIQEIKEN